MGRHFSPDLVRIYQFDVVVNDGIVNRVFDEPELILNVPQPRGIGLVLGEKKSFGWLQAKVVGAELRVRCFDQTRRLFLQARSPIVASPPPGIPEQKRREKVEGGRLRSGVGYGDARQNVEWVGFGIFDLDFKKAFPSQRARVPELKFRIESAPGRILSD